MQHLLSKSVMTSNETVVDAATESSTAHDKAQDKLPLNNAVTENDDDDDDSEAEELNSDDDTHSGEHSSSDTVRLQYDTIQVASLVYRATP